MHTEKNHQFIKLSNYLQIYCLEMVLYKVMSSNEQKEQWKFIGQGVRTLHPFTQSTVQLTAIHSETHKRKTSSSFWACWVESFFLSWAYFSFTIWVGLLTGYYKATILQIWKKWKRSDWTAFSLHLHSCELLFCRLYFSVCLQK